MLQGATAVREATQAAGLWELFSSCSERGFAVRQLHDVWHMHLHARPHARACRQPGQRGQRQVACTTCHACPPLTATSVTAPMRLSVKSRTLKSHRTNACSRLPGRCLGQGQGSRGEQGVAGLRREHTGGTQSARGMETLR